MMQRLERLERRDHDRPEPGLALRDLSLREYVLQQPLVGFPEEIAEPHAGAPRLKRLRILIVEDEQDSAESLALLLTYYQHEVWIAPEGVTALQLAATCHPEVILLDIGLPRMDGYEVARYLRQVLGLRDTKIVSVSGMPHVQEEERWKEAGIDLHLVKPVDPYALLAILDLCQEEEA